MFINFGMHSPNLWKPITAALFRRLCLTCAHDAHEASLGWTTVLHGLAAELQLVLSDEGRQGKARQDKRGTIRV